MVYRSQTLFTLAGIFFLNYKIMALQTGGATALPISMGMPAKSGAFASHSSKGI
jgi:hypothetical protein